jgi:hypothetical protein
MQSRLSLIESKLDKAVGTDTGKRAPATPDQILSSFRVSSHFEKGEGSKEGNELAKHDTPFHFPRSDCPSFKGTNRMKWLRKCLSYFELH